MTRRKPQPRVKGKPSTRSRTRLCCKACGEVLTSEKGAERHALTLDHPMQEWIPQGAKR